MYNWQWLKRSFNEANDPCTYKSSKIATDYKKVSSFDEGVKKNVGKSISMKLKGCFVEDPLTAEAYNKYFKEKNIEPTTFRSSQ